MSLLEKLKALSDKQKPLSSTQIRAQSWIFFLLAVFVGTIQYFILQWTGDIYIVLPVICALLFFLGLYTLITGKLPKA